MKKLFPTITLLALTLGFFTLSFTATAYAAGSLTADGESLFDMARPLLDAVMHGQYWLGASLALVLAVTAFKQLAPAGKLQDFAHSDAGGAILVLLGSLGGALATALIASGTNAVSMALLWAALKVALGAAGGYSLIKKLVVEPLMASSWYLNSAPAWLKSVMGLLLWAFTKPSATDAATQAGNDAVVANPPTGADGSAGTPTDL